ncbi:MAG: AAA family ATPase, partial [Porticoccus sp.]|nr:AAA family ATPase [Porticoccus sp.]
CELTEPVFTESQLSLHHRARLPYLSPEQTGRVNRKVDYRTDFYSLGVVFYELLTGNPPCISEEPSEIIHFHIAKRPIPPNKLEAEVPEQVSAIVMRLLEKNTGDRYQSAMGLRHDLERCFEELNKTGKIKTFKLGQLEHSGIFQIPQKLYGRDNEIKTLLDSFDRVSSGQKSLLLVAGYSGVGKSALVHEAQRPITEKRGFFIEGKFDQYQRNTPYSAWGQAFSRLIDLLLMESEAQLSIWKADILEAAGPNGSVLTDLIPKLERVIGVQPEVPELGGIESQNRFNYVVQNFIKVIARKEHPLVVFMDDLQWIDAASMNLIKILLTDPDLSYFLIIGAYRSNEVDATHPLIMGVAELQKEKINLNQLTLENLTEGDVNALCSDTLHTSQQESLPLAKLVYSKTAGNAFFTHQILHTLHEEKQLTFDMPTHRWHWDIEVLQEMDISDNVVELMVSKIRKLPKSTQEVLQLAACIGYAFDVATLAAIDRKSEQATHRDLQAAIREDILSSLGERFRFVHDRVQQAAYSQIDSDQAFQIHLQVGQLLLAKSQEDDDLDTRILEVLGQLNRSAFLVTERPLRLAYARLNLQGAVKARNNQAYQDALTYLDAGIDFLPEAPWTSHYRLVFDLNLERAECLYMLGSLDEAETILEEMLSRAGELLEKLQCFSLLINILGSRAAYDKAIDTAWSCLGMLGIALPDPQDTEGLNRRYDEEYQWFLKQLVNKPIASLYAFPVSTDPVHIETLRLISNLADIMTINNHVANRLWIIKGINLSLQHGYGPNSAHLFSVFAVILTIDAQDYNTAYECVELGLRLAQGKLHAQHTITSSSFGVQNQQIYIDN